MKLSNEKLQAIIEKAKLIPGDQLLESSKKAKEKMMYLGDVLMEDGLVTDEHLGQLVAEELGYNFINLKKIDIDENVLRIIPELVARNKKVIAFKKNKDGISIAMADPSDLETINLIQKRSGEKIEINYATERDIIDALRRYQRGLKEEFSIIIKSYASEAKISTQPEDMPIIKIVDTILNYAYENKASDIHLEPRQDEFLVRFRIDGILHDVVELPKNLESLIVGRIKILSKLRTDEHLAAQDGKFRFLVAEQEDFESETDDKIDIRVSILPVTEGEKVVLRLLSARNRMYGLEDLGLSKPDFKKVQNAFTKPYGMILVTGPTGCGKTTTLYAVIRILNSREVNISTIEDPVEYDIEGVNQIQVNSKTNLTFANGLRSILRQDPDVIMVGEIRDEETANIAINSAMTGHLVLSTLHTNDAATTLPRLLDMKIEPFLIASTVNIIIAQRLVRKICSQCLVSYTVKREDLAGTITSELLNKHVSPTRQVIRLYHGKGCKTCNGTGYSGRIGIFEVLEITEPIRQLIMKQANSEEIKKLAISSGMTTMIDDGIQKALSGITTLEEVLRVIKE